MFIERGVKKGKIFSRQKFTAIQYNIWPVYTGIYTAENMKTKKGVGRELLEVIVHSALHSVGLKSKIHISVFPIVHVVLV